MKFAFTVALVVCSIAQCAGGQSTLVPNADTEIHAKAVRFVEAIGVRDRIQAGLPMLIEAQSAAMQKQCPDS